MRSLLSLRFSFRTAILVTLAIAAAAVLFLPTDYALAMTPNLHAAGLAISQPFSDGGGVLAMAGAAYGTYEYWHPIRHVNKNHAPPPLFNIAAFDPIECPNGVIGLPETHGFVTLWAAESLRRQAAASSDPNMQKLAASLDGAVFAFEPVVDDETLDLTDAQKSDVVANCARALSFSVNTLMIPCVEISPDPSGRGQWIEGPAIQNAWALPANLHLNDLPAFFSKIAQRYALSL